MNNQLNLIFTIIWLIILLIFQFYIEDCLYFRIFSYKRDWHYFAGNQNYDYSNQNLHYYIIVPCYNEEAVIKNTLKHLLSFNRFHVVVVDDDSSDHTLDQIKQVHSKNLYFLRRKAPNAHTGKGDVLNFALDYIRHDIEAQHLSENNVIVGVIDADAQFADNVLNKLDAYFTQPDAEVAQMRVKMYPKFKNTLQVLQDAEFFTINNLTQIMRMYTHTVGLSGNGQFFRLKPILKKIGDHPWGNALLDDYELTIKMMLKGIWVGYMPDTYVYQESLSSLKSLIRQRSRWSQGGLDCQKYLKRVLISKILAPGQKIGIFYFLAQPWLSLTADVTIVYLFISMLFRLPELKIMLSLPLFIGLFAILFCYL